MFALIDCNNFYASCERVFRPDLNGKPVAILSNNDGCVIARSNEAKACGLPMGAAAFKFEAFFKEHQINVFSSNYALYGDMSSRVMNLLNNYAPEMEIYSIDEAFLKFDGCKYINFQEYGLKIQKQVSKNTGIPISVGIAPTKALAKVANKIAKKFPEITHNNYVIDSDEKRVKALKWLKIEDVWGIGRKHAKRLQENGITTAFDFTQQTDAWIQKHLSVVGLRLKHDLEGIPNLDLEATKTKKNILISRSFERNYSLADDIKERLNTFTVTCAEKLRKQHCTCKALYIFLSGNRHRKDLTQINLSTVIQLPFASNSSIELCQHVNQAFARIFKEGYAYKKAGIVALDLAPENQQQLTLFGNSNPKHKPLMLALDKLNKGIGAQKVKLGSQDLGRTWKMKQERLSPRYTTRLKEIIEVKA